MLQYLKLPVEILFPIVVLDILLVLRLMPIQFASSTVVRFMPTWDIPARMIIATAYVLGLTAFATILGPHLTGLVSPFPIYALILAAFAHHLDGPLSAIKVLKGLLVGLSSCASFFVVVAILIEWVHVAGLWIGHYSRAYVSNWFTLAAKPFPAASIRQPNPAVQQTATVGTISGVSN